MHDLRPISGCATLSTRHRRARRSIPMPPRFARPNEPRNRSRPANRQASISDEIEPATIGAWNEPPRRRSVASASSSILVAIATDASSDGGPARPSCVSSSACAAMVPAEKLFAAGSCCRLVPAEPPLCAARVAVSPLGQQDLPPASSWLVGREIAGTTHEGVTVGRTDDRRAGLFSTASAEPMHLDAAMHLCPLVPRRCCSPAMR